MFGTSSYGSFLNCTDLGEAVHLHPSQLPVREVCYSKTSAPNGKCFNQIYFCIVLLNCDYCLFVGFFRPTLEFFTHMIRHHYR